MPAWIDCLSLCFHLNLKYPYIPYPTHTIFCSFSESSTLLWAQRRHGSLFLFFFFLVLFSAPCLAPSISSIHICWMRDLLKRTNHMKTLGFSATSNELSLNCNQRKETVEYFSGGAKPRWEVGVTSQSYCNWVRVWAK